MKKVNINAPAVVSEIQSMGGSPAMRLLANNMDTSCLRTNDVLRKEEWIHFDQAVIEAAQDRLVGVQDLMSRGLTYSFPNGLGSTVLQYEDVSDIEDAIISMDGLTRDQNDRVEFDLKNLPLPITHKDFQINARVLASSRNLGMPLDTRMAQLASIKVADKVETILFQGASSYTFGGGTIYGYMDAPNRNTYSLSANWDDSAATGETILADVLAMKQLAIDAKHYGPYMLYIPPNYETVLEEDFKSNSNKSIKMRLMEVSNIQDIKVADKLTDDNVILVEMNSETVRVVEGLPLQTVRWSQEGEMVFLFKVMTILVPQVRADQEGNSGIVHGS